MAAAQEVSAAAGGSGSEPASAAAASVCVDTSAAANTTDANGTHSSRAGPDVAAALAALQEAVGSAAADHKLVGAADALTAACTASGAALAPSTATAALEAVALAASIAVAPVFRGALILERGRLLEQLGRPQAAQAAVEAAVALLRRQPLPAGGAQLPADAHVQGLQRWVAARLLRAARVLHGLGQEAAVHELLEPLPAAAAVLSDPATYVSALGQLSNLTGGRAGGRAAVGWRLLRCSFVVPSQSAAAAAPLARAQPPETLPTRLPSARPSALPADDQVAELQLCAGMLDGRQPPPAEQQQEEAQARPAPCPWLRGFNRTRAFPLYYALHRGLHARK